MDYKEAILVCGDTPQPMWTVGLTLVTFENEQGEGLYEPQEEGLTLMLSPFLTVFPSMFYILYSTNFNMYLEWTIAPTSIQEPNLLSTSFFGWCALGYNRSHLALFVSTFW